ncbi:fructose-2,6-bisphosphatase [Limosilactobacillus fermentum]|uniref:histidine phosphatase family protein n=1 Tax=Limosilactobacillus fermentum TaxID=1613 RepID=UPI000B4D0C09|nr:histidine phosphatase family protein [Limosilactobacillus fermentum]OWP35413.1 fructose-2,6-bisphosphatase [Limosilactobacillus fermentum]
MTELYIIRHGQTAANAAGLKQGTIDDERTYLSETGIAQAKELAGALDLTGFAALYHSPLHRTVETAQIVNQTAHLPMVADDRLLEISYGDWDGQLNADLMAKYPDLFDPLINDVRATYAPVANGESFASIEARVQAFTEEVAKAHPDERVAVVTHGFTVRSFAINATQSHDLTILEPANCSVTKILVDPTNCDQHLVYYNRSANPAF